MADYFSAGSGPVNPSESMLRSDAPGPAALDYGHMDHQRMYDMVHTDNSPADLVQAGDTWTAASDAFAEIQAQMLKAISTSETEWAGAGGRAARQSMASLARFTEMSSQSARLAADNSYKQADAVETGKRDMPEPMNFNMDQAMAELPSMFEPEALADKLGQIAAKYAESHERQQRAAHVVSAMDTHLAESGSKTPVFPKTDQPIDSESPPTASGPDDTLTMPTTPPPQAGEPRTAISTPAGGVGPGSASPPPQNGPVDVPSAGPGSGTDVGTRGYSDQSTSAQGFTPGTAAPGGGFAGPPPAGRALPNPSSGLAGGTPLGGLGTGGTIPPGRHLSLGRVGEVPGARPGSSGRLGSLGGRMGASPGAGAYTGARPAPGQSGGTARGATMGGSTGRGSGGRMPMMGGAGAGRGQGGDDEQHERKYVQLEALITAEDEDGKLRDADGNMVTPPVIGR